MLRKVRRRLFQKRQNYSYAQSKIGRQVERGAKRIYKWKYRNLGLLFVSIIAAFYLAGNPVLASIVGSVGDFGYVGAFFAGLFYTYGLTTAIAAATIFLLASTLNPLLLAIIGAFGALLSDYIIFRFVRDRLLAEVKLAVEELRIPTGFWGKLLRNKWFQLFVPVIAGVIIASPIPDEFGAALFAAVKYNPKWFAVFSYGSNFIGILIISLLGQALI